MAEQLDNRFIRAHRKAVKITRANPAIGFGSSFAVAMGLFAYGGNRLDVRFGTEPRYVLCGVFLGLLYGGYEVWKLVRRGSGGGPGEGEGGGAP